MKLTCRVFRWLLLMCTCHHVRSFGTKDLKRMRSRPRASDEIFRLVIPSQAQCIHVCVLNEACQAVLYPDPGSYCLGYRRSETDGQHLESGTTCWGVMRASYDTISTSYISGCTSFNHYGNLDCSKANDNNVNTRWAAWSGRGWIQMDLAASKTVIALGLQLDNEAGGQCSSYRIIFSDGSTYEFSRTCRDIVAGFTEMIQIPPTPTTSVNLTCIVDCPGRFQEIIDLHVIIRI